MPSNCVSVLCPTYSRMVVWYEIRASPEKRMLPYHTRWDCFHRQSGDALVPVSSRDTFDLLFEKRPPILWLAIPSAASVLHSPPTHEVELRAYPNIQSDSQILHSFRYQKF